MISPSPREGAASHALSGLKTPPRQTAEVAFSQKETFGRLLFESSPVPSMIYDEETLQFLAVNKAARETYGYSQGEFSRMTLKEIYFPDEWENPARSSVPPRVETTKHRHRDGSVIHAEVSLQPISFAGREARLLYAVDATEKKELETRFLRAQRLECLGTLASGVAHDLNNILAPIMMSASMLHEELTAQGRKEFIHAIERSAQRGVSLLRQVLTFSRGVEGERIPLKPEVLIHEVAEIARQTFPKSIQVQTTHGPQAAPPEAAGEELWEIMGDATRLHQVLLNLVINARDAMEHGGVLKINAANCEIVSNRASASQGAKAGPYVAIIVADTGTGMPEEVVQKIFTPFFTTKEPGKGTGLGLPTVLGIVKGHGGFVEVLSKVGSGTTFTAYFPARSSGSELAFEPKMPAQIRGNGEAILVVDDEAGIRKMLKTVLSRHGYKVITATDGTEAVAEYVRRPGAVKLVIADLVMPSMDGVVLARAIRRLDPNARIVATSGLDSDARLQELAALGVTRFLKKPYIVPQLLAVVAEALKAEA